MATTIEKYISKMETNPVVEDAPVKPKPAPKPVRELEELTTESFLDVMDNTETEAATGTTLLGVVSVVIFLSICAVGILSMV